jgi:hypothetical protein
MANQAEYTLENSLFENWCHSRLHPDRARELSRTELAHGMLPALDQMARDELIAWINYRTRVADLLGRQFVPDVHLADAHFYRDALARLEHSSSGL